MSETLDPSWTWWTGRYTFELTWRPGITVEIDVSVRRDDAIIWWGNRTLAVIDRVLLREWLFHPREPLNRDDLVWSVEHGVTCLTIFSSTPCAVPSHAVAYLTAVI